RAFVSLALLVRHLRLHGNRQEQPPRAALRPGGRVRQQLSGGAEGGERAGLPQLRRLRIADLRKPLDGAFARGHGHGSPLRGVPRRAQLGELARPPPGRSLLALPRAVELHLRVRIAWPRSRVASDCRWGPTSAGLAASSTCSSGSTFAFPGRATRCSSTSSASPSSRSSCANPASTTWSSIG